MSKKSKIIIAISAVFIICVTVILVLFSDGNTELKTVKSEKQLLRLYEKDDYEISPVLLPFLLPSIPFFMNYNLGMDAASTDGLDSSSMGKVDPSSIVAESSTTNSSSSKDYSKTNVQVENVDEADITKTDGDYIYSISDDNVVITNVTKPEAIAIECKLPMPNDGVPQDLILYGNKLVVICATTNSYYTYVDSTMVNIYDITNKAEPELIKDFELYEPYYTSRCIDNELYIISSGKLREENDKILREYIEDSEKKEIPINSFKYLKDTDTDKQSLIAVTDLDNLSGDIQLSSYLIDISNAYVSENSIYLLDNYYEQGDGIPLKSIFGFKGVLGIFDDYDDEDDYGQKTKIIKFDIKEDKVEYTAKASIKGKTINQYSLDELNGHLRVATYDSQGARVTVFNEKMQKIGSSQPVAKGENMYSSRFIGDKVYLVTYKTMDPLFVIDVGNEENPRVLGELKIPGYSTYLHPYDENHIIGIGMETKETKNRDVYGRVTSTSARIVGMKMALFDVSDVNKPVQISQTVIGDSRTTSAILQNPKALLFSKEKNLIAIPVNNYDSDFEASTSNSESYSSLINSYTSYSGSRTAEGYFVYNIDLNEGFKLKGTITHEVPKDSKKNGYYYYGGYGSKLLRGLYIDNNLYTVSESAVKVNSLDTLELISEQKID